MPAGRPHLLTDSQCDHICELIAAGHSAAAVARLIPCNVKTIGRHSLRNERFGMLLRQARRQARYRPLDAIRRAAKTSPVARQWLARHPKIISPQPAFPERDSKNVARICRVNCDADKPRHDTAQTPRSP